MTTRRRILRATCAAAVSALQLRAQAAPPTARRLLLVHGRAQEGKDPRVLKEEWVQALKRGTAKSGKTVSSSIDVAFPYYGDLLDGYARELAIPLTTEIQARGEQNDAFLKFQFAVAEDIRRASNISEETVRVEYGGDAQERGPLNWKWVQATLRAIDKNAGGLNQASLELFTRDVFLYTTVIGVRSEVDRIVAQELREEPTVVVGHSLGSVVAYSVLRTDRRKLDVPLLATVGSPLAVRAIRDQFRPLRHPDCVANWFNAYDPRDVVALYPLDEANFPVRTPVNNFGGVANYTNNRHGIAAYLDDETVAARLVAALASGS